MSKNNKHRFHPSLIVLIIFIGLTDLALLLRRFLQGHNVALFNPQGLISKQQLNLMLLTGSVLLAIGIPTIFLLYFTAWKYRESNPKATYDPDMKRSKWLDFGIWAIPVTIMLVLASIMVPATHKLAPQKSLALGDEPMTIQVISMRWKWLFLYPEQGIATLNFVQMPTNTPVQFELTADEAPMSSFWIPNLGGQLYTMTSHVNRLNLMAEAPGDYPGSSAEINGAGFAGMKFTARASSMDDFDNWVKSVQKSPNVLDSAKYNEILKPSQYSSVALYSAFETSLYDRVISKYTGQFGGHTHNE